MRVMIDGKETFLRTVWFEEPTVRMINQPKLPHFFEIYDANTYHETADAIRTMVVRGAPAIGATAAYGMAQAALAFKGGDISRFRAHMDQAAGTLKATRPTAYDLFHAVDTVLESAKGAKDVAVAKKLAVDDANQYAEWSAGNCRMIGEHGEKLIKNGARLLTHCNAGALACVDFGTALAPMRAARSNGKDVFVWVDETRPRCQGARLTAWELGNEGIRHAVIADNAAGHFMRAGEVDLVIVGADRVAKNGDIANKIGTYEKAVLARENGIPFYVAAPASTIDLKCASGKQIDIEERSEEEVSFMFGLHGNSEFSRVRIAPEGSSCRNPAFDVTPAKYITGIITEKGVFPPGGISAFFSGKGGGKK